MRSQFLFSDVPVGTTFMILSSRWLWSSFRRVQTHYVKFLHTENHQCCSRKLVATFKSLFEALRASSASPLENPISISRATWKRNNTALKTEFYSHCVCIRHVSSVRDHFSTDQAVEKLTFPESKQAWLCNITDIPGTARLKTLPQRWLLSDTLLKTNRLLKMPHLCFPNWSSFERVVK